MPLQFSLVDCQAPDKVERVFRQVATELNTLTVNVANQASGVFPRFVRGASVTTRSGELVVWEDSATGDVWLVYDKAGTQMKTQLT